MAHDHRSHDDDTYFIDQISMVGLSGAFGVICLALFFVQTWMLNLLLGQQFHLMIAISGFVLLGLAIVRAVGLWREAKPADTHAHHHDHDHAECGNDHGPCDHDHAHDHGHAHQHDHTHNHDDHDHGWAPWRYVVMLVPIILFLLGLPNKGPSAADHDDVAARNAETIRESSDALVSAAAYPWSQLLVVAKIANDDALGNAIPAGFKKLYDSVGDETERRFFEGKTVRIRGQFSPYPSDPRFFALVRFQIGCCAGDAVDKRIAVFSREPITTIKRNDWAEVVGKVEYAKRGETYIMRLATNGPDNVQMKPADPDPYFK